jgi:hypothetical protein
MSKTTSKEPSLGTHGLIDQERTLGQDSVSIGQVHAIQGPERLGAGHDRSLLHHTAMRQREDLFTRDASSKVVFD